MRAVFLRLLESEDKQQALKLVASDQAGLSRGRWRFVRDPLFLRGLPGGLFAYWIADSLLSAFEKYPPIESHGIDVRSTNPLNNDFRFARLSWEVPWSDIGHRWAIWAKGGAQSTFYCDIPNLIAWNPMERTFRGFLGTPSRPLERPASSQYFLRPGITWPRRTSGLSMRVLPSGAVFADKGPALFENGDRGAEILAVLAICCSRPFNAAVEVQLARTELARSFEVGIIQRTPVPDLDPDSSDLLAGLAHRGWSLRRSLDAVKEVSHAFVLPAVLRVEGGSFGDCVVGWAERVAGVEVELAGVQFEIDELCFELYGISEADRKAIIEGFGISDDSGVDDDLDGDEGSVVELDPVGLAAGLVSWCVGVVTGRFDVRLATGDRAWPSEPDPFDPLPVCSPAMLTCDDGLPLSESPVGYPVDLSPVLVVDAGHRLDVTARVRDVFDVVFGDQADVWWTEVGEVLDPRGGEIGSWLSKGFFEHHLKTYSKSRRKAPIVWPIGTRSGSYQVWLYAHRVTGDSLFRVLNDLIVPKLNAEESRLVRLRQEAGPNPSASERKAIDIQEKFVSEMVELRELVEGLAPLWAPDLNDGVVIVLAPLWRLFGHHKPWMRELKKHWEKLVNGDYDWAQLAMHLWPERVIPKCAVDRSFAIAHGLEDVFWEPDPDHDDKWISRDTPTVPIDQLIADRHNPTTKTALNTMDTT